MDAAYPYLKEWIINYLKNRDLLFRKIEAVEENKEGFDFYIQFKDKGQFFIVMPVMQDVGGIFTKLDSERHFGLVVLNTSSNFKVLLENWEKFAQFRHLCVYFVNPFLVRCSFFV